MTESVRIPVALITCSISDYGDLTLEVYIPQGQKGHPGFTIHNGKVIQGRIPWRSLEIQSHKEKSVDLSTIKREGGLAKCEGCGVTLISPYDGQPYWCQECSIEYDK